MSETDYNMYPVFIATAVVVAIICMILIGTFKMNEDINEIKQTVNTSDVNSTFKFDYCCKLFLEKRYSLRMGEEQCYEYKEVVLE